MENEEIKEQEQKQPTKLEMDGLFYKMLNRRPLIDVVQDQEEQDYWKKQMDSSNDITLYSWRNEWVRNLRDNKTHFGYFHRDHSVKVFSNDLTASPIILVGAGPSLATNLPLLRQAKDKNIKIMATHHALMYLADIDVKPDFVCVLDAGQMWDDYFAFDKLDCSDVPLLADMTCNTEQLKKWKGPIYFYRSAHPDKSNVAKFLKMEMDRLVEPFESGSVIEVGGHAMGACMALSKGVMAANTIIFVGSDYCFDRNNNFYPFDHKIDKVVTTENPDGTFSEKPAPPPPQGQILDIFGNVVATNGCYLQFKNVMDIGIKINKAHDLSQGGDMDFINACEGGALGALQNGNSMWMQYMQLEEAIHYADVKRTTKLAKIKEVK